MTGGAWAAAGAALAVFGVLAVVSVAGIAPTNVLGIVQQPLPTPIQHVFLIMMENQQTRNIVPGQPYETHLAGTYAWGGDSYYAICHPSTGNYMALSTGQPLHCGSDGYTTYSANNLFNLMQTNNVPWVAYAESMTTPCQTGDAGNYAVRHNPPPYFTDIASVCAAKDLPIANLVNDYPFSATPPAFTYIAPNLINDAHSSSAAAGDAWLSSFVPKLMAQSWFASTVIFITYDESGNPQLDTGPGGGPVPFIAVSPYTAGVGALSSTNSHYNALATFEWLLGLPCTGSGNDCGAAPMKALFSFGSGNPLAITSFTAVPSSVAVGATATLSVAASGGVAPYAYAFSGLPPGCASADLARLLCAPSAAGTFGITATVTDSAGASAHASATLTVTGPGGTGPSLSAILIDPANPVANASYSLSASASGGTPPYSFSWSALPQGCRPSAPTATGAAAMCTTSSPGTYTATLTVTDSVGKTATSTASVNVSAVAPPPPCCTSRTTATTLAGWFEAPAHLAMLGSAALVGVGVALLVMRRVEVGVLLLIVGGGAYVFL